MSCTHPPACAAVTSASDSTPASLLIAMKHPMHHHPHSSLTLPGILSHCPRVYWLLSFLMLTDDCSCPTGTPQCPALQVWVEALHIAHQPVCWQRLSGLFAGGTQDTQAARLTQATNLLDSPEAQTVAQAYRVINTSVLPAITVQVCLSSAYV